MALAAACEGEGEGSGEEWCSAGGWWQARLALLLALPVLLTGAHTTNYVFLAAPTPHRCHVPECEGNVSVVSAVWAAPWTAAALPAAEACHRWPPLDGSCRAGAFDNTTLVPCDAYVYQQSSSIVFEFGLACQEWKRSLVGTVHNIGMLVSLPVMGLVSDRWGRRAALVASGCGAGAAGLAKSFAPSYRLYVVAELTEAVFGASVYPSAFVLMIEWLRVEHRILASLVLGIPLALGAAGLALLDYLTGYWRLWARCAYPPAFLLLLYPWLLPESVRWLLARGHTRRALATARRAAAADGCAPPPAALDRMLAHQKKQLEAQQAQPDETLLRALVKYGALRRRLAVCCVWWLTAVFVFYGLAATAGALAGSAHVNYALLAAAQVPALAANTLLLERVGRRPVLTGAFLATALALGAMACLPRSGGAALAWAGRALYVCGQAGATMALNCLYVYTAELFPTAARHTLLAVCSTAGRLGAVVAPLAPLLASVGAWVPAAVFACAPLASAALTRLVPDTLRRRLPAAYGDLAPAAPCTHL